MPFASASGRESRAKLFGHPIHTMLIVFPLGLLATALLFDAWMPEVVVRDLRVGPASVSLRFWRDGRGSSKWDVLHEHGTLHVLRQPPPEARSVGVLDRVKTLTESIAS
jgi:hypothetical protein